MHPTPTTCPVCARVLAVERLRCPACATAIEGRFSLGRLGRLTREQLAFVETFVGARGKIKDVEVRLGVSYPTVVARLEEVVRALGGDGDGDASGDATATDDVLEALSRGELTATEAAAKLRGAKPKRKDT